MDLPSRSDDSPCESRGERRELSDVALCLQGGESRAKARRRDKCWMDTCLHALDGSKPLVRVVLPVHRDTPIMILERFEHELARRDAAQVKFGPGEPKERGRGQVDIVFTATCAAVHNAHSDLGAVPWIGDCGRQRTMALFASSTVDESIAANDGVRRSRDSFVRRGEEITTGNEGTATWVAVGRTVRTGPCVIGQLGLRVRRRQSEKRHREVK